MKMTQNSSDDISIMEATPIMQEMNKALAAAGIKNFSLSPHIGSAPYYCDVQKPNPTSGEKPEKITVARLYLRGEKDDKGAYWKIEVHDSHYFDAIKKFTESYASRKLIARMIS